MRSLRVRTRRGRLGEAMPQIRLETARAGNVTFESNSVLGLLGGVCGFRRAQIGRRKEVPCALADLR